jgi:hypothetical protein
MATHRLDRADRVGLHRLAQDRVGRDQKPVFVPERANAPTRAVVIDTLSIPQLDPKGEQSRPVKAGLTLPVTSMVRPRDRASACTATAAAEPGTSTIAETPRSNHGPAMASASSGLSQ